MVLLSTLALCLIPQLSLCKRSLLANLSVDVDLNTVAYKRQSGAHRTPISNMVVIIDRQICREYATNDNRCWIVRS